MRDEIRHEERLVDFIVENILFHDMIWFTEITST